MVAVVPTDLTEGELMEEARQNQLQRAREDIAGLKLALLDLLVCLAEFLPELAGDMETVLQRRIDALPAEEQTAGMGRTLDWVRRVCLDLSTSDKAPQVPR